MLNQHQPMIGKIRTGRNSIILIGDSVIQLKEIIWFWTISSKFAGDSDFDDIAILVTSWCWWREVGGNLWMLVSDAYVKR